MLSILFGSELRQKILLYLEECGEAYSSELAKNFAASLFAVQSQLKKLEEAGILVSRNAGKTRMYTINPRYFLKTELIALLKKIWRRYRKRRYRNTTGPGDGRAGAESRGEKADGLAGIGPVRI